ncbi:hypothetical protein Dsin_008628 [Dipteronia sinensis]|uniref:Reverse transcriptase zinc-binding domain-containing protein n=1 Tax=Dipteronia sinensis TaxID=43782 RepID=A0AAE0EAU6_9ROSI|nr:hypothetical protein Dsin_008628 [Dipteronia sinensis]
MLGSLAVVSCGWRVIWLLWWSSFVLGLVWFLGIGVLMGIGFWVCFLIWTLLPLIFIGKCCHDEVLSDNLVWSFCPQGCYSVASFRIQLEDNAASGSQDSAAKVLQLWKGICPPKVEVFAWQLLRGKVHVKEVLSWFGCAPNGGLECPLSVCHGRARNVGFAATIWTIWEARNQIVFKDSVMDLAQWVVLIKFRIVWWFKQHGKGSSEPITTFLLNIRDLCKDFKPEKVVKRGTWSPPQHDTLKINVDRSARGSTGQAGIGGDLLWPPRVACCLFLLWPGWS